MKSTPKENKVYERCTAQVKFYSRDKGFGFLKRPNKDDVYFSQSTLERCGIRSIKENDTVDFDLIPVPGKGGKAQNMKIVANAPKQ